MNQLLWFCPLFSCLMQLPFKKKKKHLLLHEPVPQFSDSVRSKRLILSRAALLHPDWLVRIPRWQRSATTRSRATSPDWWLLSWGLGWRLSDHLTHWHWITGIYFSIISSCCFLCGLKPNLWPTGGKCCWTHRQEMQLLLLISLKKKKMNIYKD